jgi:hypothetical protein
METWGSGMGPHPDEVKIVAPARSVILFNSADLWHSGTHNYSPAPRLAVTAGLRPRQPIVLICAVTGPTSHAPADRPYWLAMSAVMRHR